MNRQKKFVEMMEALIGKSINLGDPIGQNKVELEASCAKLKDELGTEFVVNPNKGNEPCPFYCSSIDKPFDFVFIGMNPGKVLDAQTELNLFSWENTTWQELADFCVPTDIRGEMNGYQLVKLGKKKKNGTRKNGPESEFWKFFLRFHVALTGGEIFNTWDDLKSRHANTEELFIEHVARYSVLNADLVPYKYKETPKFNTTNLLKDPNYEKYFHQLIQFIKAETKPDAWIVFYATTGAVKDLFDRFAPDWNVPPKANLHFKPEPNKDTNHFYIFNREQRKILLSPFLTGSPPQPMRKHIDILVDAMKNFEKKLSLS